MKNVLDHTFVLEYNSSLRLILLSWTSIVQSLKFIQIRNKKFQMEHIVLTPSQVM